MSAPEQPRRIYRRNSTETNAIFWRAVERDMNNDEHRPPAEVIELLGAGGLGVPVGEARYLDVCEWARTMEGWTFAPRPMYARAAGPDGLGATIDMGD